MRKLLIFICFIFIVLESNEIKIDRDKVISKYYHEFLKYIPNFNNTISGNSIAIRNNNPGNLKYDERFAKFNSIEEGYDALMYDLMLKVSGKSKFTDSTTTLSEFVHIYAPKHENDTKDYLYNLCIELNVKSDIKLSDINVNALGKAIIKLEDINLHNSLY